MGRPAIHSQSLMRLSLRRSSSVSIDVTIQWRGATRLSRSVPQDAGKSGGRWLTWGRDASPAAVVLVF
jgi:hypothetical protein